MGCLCSKKKISRSPDEVYQVKKEITETSSKTNVDSCGNKNIDETLHESTSIISDQHSKYELIEVSEIKPCNKNLENYENDFVEIERNLKERSNCHENKSDENHELIEVSEFKPCNKNLEKNEKDFVEMERNLKKRSDRHENKTDESHSAKNDSDRTKKKIHERRTIFFESFHEIEPKEDMKSKITKMDNSFDLKKTSTDKIYQTRIESNELFQIILKEEIWNEVIETVDEEKMTKRFIEELINHIILKTIKFVEKKERDEIAKEILNTVLSETIAQKEINNYVIEEFVNIILSNAINIVVKITIDELLNELLIEIFDELLNETLPGILESVIPKPLGFANPKGYCYLNSVVQVLGSCEDFKKDIYNYNWNTTEKTNDSIFVEGLFNLIRAIRECNKECLDEYLNVVQQNITESSFGDDVYKCFMNLLTRVSNVIKTNTDGSSDHFSSLAIPLSEKAKSTFTRFKNRNPGFVFDNFYGQLTFQTVCKLCNTVCNESFQMIKSLPLPVPKSNSSETLNSCIDMFFNESDVEVDEPMKCKCVCGSSMSLKSITKLTYGPKYLFIYLNRGSYTDDGDKNNTHVTCDNLTIHIRTLEEKSIKYKLVSVIDHIGDSAYGHYYCKCSFETDEWWLLNDSQVELLKNPTSIVTDKAIVFLFKIIL